MPRAPILHLRELCLALPEAEERETWGEATFRIRGRIFAMQATGGRAPALWCKAPPGSQAILVGADPTRFFAPPYLGPKGWIGIWLDGRPDWAEIGALIRRSYALIAPKRLAQGLDPAASPPVRRRARLAAAAAVPLLLAAAPASAQQAEAVYVVRQAGFNVMEARVVLDLGQRGYRITADARTQGLAVLFANSRTRLQAEGRWVGHSAMPDRFASAGVINGRQRRIEMAYRGDQVELLQQEPPDSTERTPVTPDQRRGTVDILSALARLVRHAGATGSCDGAQSVYDGRRRLEWSARTEALGPAVARAGGRWTPIMRCSFTSRVVAGFRHGDDTAAGGRPRSGSALLAMVRPDLPPLPVSLEFPWGILTLRAELVRLDDPRAGRSDGSGE